MPSAPPAAEQLATLPDDVWTALVVHLRRVLADLPDDQHTPRTRQLATVPTRRLVSGRSRRDVERRLAEGGPMWVQLRRRVLGDPDLAAALGAALAGVREEATRDREGLDDAVPAAPGGADPQEVERLRSRLRRTRDQRDRARRRAEGETARADREARARQNLERRVEDLDARVDELQQSLRSAAREREAAVERERRRSQATIVDLQEQLRGLRREREERRRRQRARDEAEETRQRQPAAPTPVAPPRLVPGRPSRLPDQVRAGTTEAVDLLLHAGRLVLVDGYNVTRTHRPDLDLEGQRRWLVNLLAGATAARGIEPTVIFDGHGTTGVGSSRRERGVWVQFTAEGITADDDLVFQAEAIDPGTPLVVVTDDRELRDRLASLRVDLVPTGALVGALR